MNDHDRSNPEHPATSPATPPASPAPAAPRAPAAPTEAGRDPLSGADWYYALGAEPSGPVPLRTLEECILARQILRRTLVWTPGMASWVAAGSIEAFASLFGEDGASPVSADTPGGLGTSAGSGLRPPAAPMRPPTVPGPIVNPADRERTLGERLLLPVGRSGYAIAAGYCGLASLFPVVGGAAGLIGVCLGVMAVRDIRRHPHRHGLGRAWFGIIVGGLSVIIHLLVVLAAVLD